MRNLYLMLPALVGAFILGLGVGIYSSSKKSEAQTMGKKLEANHRVDPSGKVLGGLTTGVGLSIRWRGADSPEGVDPIDLIAAASDRLKHLQTTASGGNETAKALWSVEKCLDELNAIYSNQAPRSSAGSAAGFGGTQETEAN